MRLSAAGNEAKKKSAEAKPRALPEFPLFNGMLRCRHFCLAST